MFFFFQPKRVYLKKSLETPLADNKDLLILIVEDSPINRTIILNSVKKMAYQPIACTNGEEAWQTLEQKKDRKFVAIISDIFMPKLNGFDLLKKVRSDESYKDIPLIFITGNTDKEAVLQAKELGVTNYLLKPINSKDITDTLKQVLAA